VAIDRIDHLEPNVMSGFQDICDMLNDV